MTKDKTVTMSRELAEVLSREYPVNVTDRVTIRSIQTQQRLAREELRALIAAPVVERQPIAEVQHGPFDDVGAPQWVRVVTLGDFDLENIPDGTKLWTSPPAPVAVALPIDIKQRLNDVWLFLDGQAGLNGCVFGEKPEGRHQFWWRKELRSVVEDLNACLDKVKELNNGQV